MPWQLLTTNFWGIRGQRNGQERRQRIERYFDCTWLSEWGTERGRVSSLSPTGCYVESRFTVPAEGVVVEDITIAVPTGSLTLRGTVLTAMRGVGFALRFIEPDIHMRESLSALVQHR